MGKSNFPLHPKEVRNWLRGASSKDLGDWLSADDRAFGMFSPIANLLSSRVLALPEGPGSPLRMRFVAGERVLNPWGNVHGGVVLGLMDEVASTAAALYVSPRYFGATTTLSVSFIRPLREREFEVSALVVGRSLGALTVRVEIYDHEQRLHDQGIATFALRSPVSTPVPSPV